MKTPVRLSLLLSAALVATSTLLADSFTPGNYTYTVTTSGVYQITVAGAAGGNSNPASGGKGAVLTGDFSLSSGDILSIGVGAKGCSSFYSSCGGGGSLVQIQGGTLLLDAGAGGGGGEDSRGQGGDALLTPDGESSAGGSGGTGGADGGPGYYTQGGGGFYGRGSTSGGDGYNSSAGGGGGGYSGGAGTNAGNGGGGGGSYYNAATLELETAIRNTGDGYASVTLLHAQSTAVTPEPSSLLLLGTGALGLARAIRRRDRTGFAA